MKSKKELREEIRILNKIISYLFIYSTFLLICNFIFVYLLNDSQNLIDHYIELILNK
jgi:Trk-type K+ transport system membrane component